MTSKNIILPVLTPFEKQDHLLNILNTTENNKNIYPIKNNLNRKLFKTYYILRRGVINNLGKIIIFAFLIIILLIFLIEYEIPIDGSYIENSTKFQRFLTLLNIIIISIIVSGTISIFNIENQITKDRSENKDEIFCKYGGIIDLLDYDYLLQPIENHANIKDLIESNIKYSILFKENLTDEEVDINNALIEKMFSTSTINDLEHENLQIIKDIIYEKLILNFILDDITNNNKSFMILKKIKELIKKLDIENYTNIHVIKEEITINIKNLLKYINNKKQNITQQTIQDYYAKKIKYLEKYYMNLDENKLKTKSSEVYKIIKDKSLRNKNLYLYNFFKSNKLPLYKNDFNKYISNLNKTDIDNIYNKLHDTCKSLEDCKN